jgi:hypothetical protein
MERKFRTGNVFKLHDSLCIVTGERTINGRKITDWVSFDSEACSGSTPNVTELVEEMCWECDTNDSEYADYECENCKGTGYYKKERLGMDRAVYLAPNVKKYIIGKLLGNFDFNVYLSM